MVGMNGNIPCGSVFQIPIKVNVLLPLFVVFQCLTLVPYGARAVIWGAIVFGPILFTSARSVGGKAHQIILWPLGGLAFISHESGPVGDLWVTFAGPLTHIPQAGAWLLLSWLMDASSGPHRPRYDSSEFGRSLVGTAVWMNISLMLFNLLCPAYPLDGGRILVDLMLIVGVPASTAAWITIVVAVAVAVALVVATIVFRFFNFAGLLVAVFILFSTFGLYRYLKKGQIEQHPLFKQPSEGDDPVAEMLPKNDAPANPEAAQV